MLKILHLLPHLGVGGAAGQVGLLVDRLPPNRFTVRVAALGRDGLAGDTLRRAGTSAVAFRARHRLDPGPLVAWRRLLAEFRPDVVHAWRPGPIRFALLFNGRPRLVVSEPLRGRRSPHLSWLERRFLGRAERILITGPTELAAWKSLGGATERVTVVTPGVAVSASVPDREDFCRTLDIPAGARLIMTGGELRRSRGFRDAVWAFDVVRYLARDAYLVILGDGPERVQLEAFGRRVARGDYRIRFAGERADAAALLALAELVWVPHWPDGGTSLAREAAAVRVPVVAVRRPDLAEIVADGSTGLLLGRGRHIDWAKATLALLADDARHRELGESARRRAREFFAPDRFAVDVAALYEHPT